VLGDVLILQTETERGLKIHAVGRGHHERASGFHQELTPLYIVDHDEALTVARRPVALGGHIYLAKVDTDDWVDIS
jgi:hypothetical protein